VYDGLSGSIPAPEVSFAEITADLLEARFWIVSGLLTIHPKQQTGSTERKGSFGLALNKAL
jgi:hypothetical protein